MKIIIKESTFGKCTFVNCSFVSVTFENIEFHDCIFDNCSLLKTKFRHSYIDPSCFRFNFDIWKKDAANVNTWLFQELNRNSQEMFQSDFATIAYKQFRRYRRSERLFKVRDQGLYIKLKARCPWLVDKIYEITMGYGYGLTNTLITTVIFLLVTVGLVDYCWVKLNVTSNVQNLQEASIWEKLYFIVVTASTLGYGDLSPKSTMGMIFVVVLLLGSILWTAAVTAIFVKKLTK